MRSHGSDQLPTGVSSLNAQAMYLLASSLLTRHKHQISMYCIASLRPCRPPCRTVKMLRFRSPIEFASCDPLCPVRFVTTIIIPIASLTRSKTPPSILYTFMGHSRGARPFSLVTRRVPRPRDGSRVPDSCYITCMVLVGATEDGDQQDLQTRFCITTGHDIAGRNRAGRARADAGRPDSCACACAIKQAQVARFRSRGARSTGRAWARAR